MIDVRLEKQKVLVNDNAPKPIPQMVRWLSDADLPKDSLWGVANDCIEIAENLEEELAAYAALLRIAAYLLFKKAEEWAINTVQVLNASTAHLELNTPNPSIKSE